MAIITQGSWGFQWFKEMVEMVNVDCFLTRTTQACQGFCSFVLHLSTETEKPGGIDGWPYARNSQRGYGGQRPPHLSRQKMHVPQGRGPTWSSFNQGHWLRLITHHSWCPLDSQSRPQPLECHPSPKAKSSLLCETFLDLLNWNFHGFSSSLTFFCSTI